MIYGMADENMIAQTRAKSREGVIGRVLAGYSGGSVAYGYRPVRESSDTPYAFGQAASKGTRFEVIEDEALNIRRVMEEFANGHSVWSICMRLNAEGVPWPHNKQGKWTVDGIKRILHNEKYRGVNTWNLTSQEKDPDTGQITRKPRPVKEHVKVPAVTKTPNPENIGHLYQLSLRSPLVMMDDCLEETCQSGMLVPLAAL
jgi:hypothetical protein